MAGGGVSGRGGRTRGLASHKRKNHAVGKPAPPTPFPASCEVAGRGGNRAIVRVGDLYGRVISRSRSPTIPTSPQDPQARSRPKHRKLPCLVRSGQPDSRIAKMKDGGTHMAHKAEHAVDLSSGALLAVTLQAADQGETTTPLIATDPAKLGFRPVPLVRSFVRVASHKLRTTQNKTLWRKLQDQLGESASTRPNKSQGRLALATSDTVGTRRSAASSSTDATRWHLLQRRAKPARPGMNQLSRSAGRTHST